MPTPDADKYIEALEYVDAHGDRFIARLEIDVVTIRNWLFRRASYNTTLKARQLHGLVRVDLRRVKSEGKEREHAQVQASAGA